MELLADQSGGRAGHLEGFDRILLTGDIGHLVMVNHVYHEFLNFRRLVLIHQYPARAAPGKNLFIQGVL